MTLKAQWYRDRLAKKARRGFCGYPVATVAFYEPDDTRATKVSVGIVAYEDADADPVERWFCAASDVRTDPEITEAVVRFIEQQGARSVATVDRIIGCPHEEGIDYPEGEACPLCPFWRDRDRGSGEIIGSVRSAVSANRCRAAPGISQGNGICHAEHGSDSVAPPVNEVSRAQTSVTGRDASVLFAQPG